jgi:hypothetical protein
MPYLRGFQADLHLVGRGFIAPSVPMLPMLRTVRTVRTVRVAGALKRPTTASATVGGGCTAPRNYADLPNTCVIDPVRRLHGFTRQPSASVRAFHATYLRY